MDGAVGTGYTGEDTAAGLVMRITGWYGWYGWADCLETMKSRRGANDVCEMAGIEMGTGDGQHGRGELGSGTITTIEAEEGWGQEYGLVTVFSPIKACR